MNLLNIINFNSAMGYPDLFADIQLPTGIDKEILVNNIIKECWDLEPIYPQPILFKSMIDAFFAKKYSDYLRMYTALSDDYNPLHNFDRFEEKDENRQNDRSYKRNENRSMDSEVNRSNEDTGNSETTNKVSAYDSSSFSNSDQESSTDSRNVTENSTQNDSENVSIDDTDNTTDTYTTKNHLYGNIGVTTSQQMLESEIKLRSTQNIYDIITFDFRAQFMLRLLI